METIEREIEEALVDEAATRPCMVVTGGRQTGKTHILAAAFHDVPYVTLDLPLVAAEAEESGGMFLEKLGTPLILDEVQYAPSIFRYIKAKVDRNRNVNGQYLLSGSQKFQMMKGLVESLAGRVGVVDLHTLSLREIRNYQHAEVTKAKVFEWCVQGGYPELHAQSLLPERFYSSLVVTYLERDVRSAIQVRSLLDFNRFMRLLASRTAQLVSAHAIGAELGIAANTVRTWLEVLEASSIIQLLPPYFPRNFGKRIVKTPKLYFLDTGLLCFLLGIKSARQLAESSLAGAVFETLAYGQLLRWHTNKLIQTPIYFFRDHAGREADFVVPESDGVRIFDAKLASRPDVASLNPAAHALEAAGEVILEKILLTPDSGDVELAKSGVTLRGVVDPMGAPYQTRVGKKRATKAVGRTRR